MFGYYYFFCSDGPVYAYQSLLAPLSPLLSNIFKSFQCCSCQGVICSKKEKIQVHLEIEQKLLQKILSLVHKGFVRLDSNDDVNLVKDGLSMLDIDIDKHQKHKQLTNSTEEHEDIAGCATEYEINETSAESSFICPFRDCDRTCFSRKKFLLHILMTHYEEQILQEFAKGKIQI